MVNEDDIEINVVGLTSLRNGALVEMFDIEMQKVAKNMMDPNTSAKKERSVTIKVSFKPDEERGSATCAIQTTATLAPIKPAATTIFMSELRDGRIDLTEYNPKQPKLTFENVTEIKKSEVV